MVIFLEAKRPESCLERWENQENNPREGAFRGEGREWTKSQLYWYHYERFGFEKVKDARSGMGLESGSGPDYKDPFLSCKEFTIHPAGRRNH